MPGIVRQGLDNIGGGQVIGKPVTVLANGAIVSTVGDTCITHGETPHIQGTAIMPSGSSSVFAGGFPVCVVGLSPALCGHLPSPGSPNVIVGR